MKNTIVQHAARKALRKSLYTRGIERIRQTHNLPADAPVVAWFKRVSLQHHSVTYENPHTGTRYDEEEFELIQQRSAVPIYTIEMNADQW